MNISDWNKRVKKGKKEAPKVEELTFKAISIWFQNQLHSIRQHCPRCVCTCVCIYPSVQFSCWVMSDSLWPHGLQYTRLPYQSPSTRACSNSCPLSRWCHPPFHPLLFPSPPTPQLQKNKWPNQKMEKTLESPLDTRRSNQSIVKEIGPEYSLEGLMLKRKRQYGGHLMQRTDSL